MNQRFALVPADKYNCRRVTLRMRPEDEREARAMSGQSPSTALRTSVARSDEAYVCEAPNGKALAVFGVTPHMDLDGQSTGLIWMLGTTTLADHPRSLVACARAWLPKVLKDYPGGVGNLVAEDNVVHVAWLKRLGAVFLPGGSIELRGTTFVPFYIVPEALEV